MFLNMSSTKVNSNKIVEKCSNTNTKALFCKMHKFWGQTELWNFRSAKFFFLKQDSLNKLNFWSVNWSFDPSQLGYFFKKWTNKTDCNFQFMKSPVKMNSLFLKFFCYITWLDEMRHWGPCKRGLYDKSCCFFETIA